MYDASSAVWCSLGQLLEAAMAKQREALAKKKDEPQRKSSHLDSNFLHYSPTVVALLRAVLKSVDKGSSTEHSLQPTGCLQHLHTALSTFTCSTTHSAEHIHAALSSAEHMHAALLTALSTYMQH